MTFKHISRTSLPSGSPPATPRASNTPTSTLPSVRMSDAGPIAERDPRPVWTRPVEDNTARLGELLARSPGSFWTTVNDVGVTWIWIAGRNKVLALEPGALISDIENMVRIAEASIQPMPREEIIKLLTRVYFTTTARKESDDDLRMRFGVWADELAELPGDAVREALREWIDTQKFWPALSEIKEVVRRMHGGYRVAVRDRLRKELQKRREQA
jgi:hypothetical protein